MKAMWRGNKDGYIFVYAIDNHESFEQLLKDIETIKQNKLYQNVLLRKLRYQLLQLEISKI